MNFQFYLEKLQNSENYKKFIKENPKAYFCSGFFVIDLEQKSKEKMDKQHFDFYLSEQKKMLSFQIEESCKLVPVEIIDKRIPEKISEKINFDFDVVIKLIEERMQKENLKNKLQKILLSLQSLNNKPALIGTLFISNLGMIKIQIDLKKMELIVFEKKSFFDFLKIKRNKKKIK